MASAFDHLETPLKEAPLFPCEPRDKDLTSEADRQGQARKRVRSAGLYFAAVLNGEKRGQWALNLARKLGAWWGFPDAIVVGPNRFIAFIEFKDGTDRLQQHQIDCLNILHRLGFPVCMARSADFVMEFLRSAGAPIRERAA